MTQIKDANAVIAYYTENLQQREIYRAWQSVALAVHPSENDFINLEIYFIPGEADGNEDENRDSEDRNDRSEDGNQNPEPRRLRSHEKKQQ